MVFSERHHWEPSRQKLPKDHGAGGRAERPVTPEGMLLAEYVSPPHDFSTVDRMMLLEAREIPARIYSNGGKVALG